jgi:hypothetical protein
MWAVRDRGSAVPNQPRCPSGRMRPSLIRTRDVPVVCQPTAAIRRALAKVNEIVRVFPGSRLAAF